MFPLVPPYLTIAIAGHRQVFDGAPAPPAADALLMETGDYLLLEIGDRISLE